MTMDASAASGPGFLLQHPASDLSRSSSLPSSSSPPSAAVVIVLAVALLISLSVSVWSVYASIRDAARAKEDPKNGPNNHPEHDLLLDDSDEDEHERRDDDDTDGDDQRPSLAQWIREAARLMLLAGLLGVTTAKLSVESHASTWLVLWEVELIVLAVYLTSLSLLGVLHVVPPSLSRLQQGPLAFISLVFLAIRHILPYFLQSRPHASAVSSLGMAQTAVVAALFLIVLSTPPDWSPVLPKAKPHPAQVASPLSRLFFTFLELRMIRYYLGSSRRSSSTSASEDFLKYVPVLPDVLHTQHVLHHFRWRGDEPRASANDEERVNTIGGVRAFMWTFRIELVKILCFATVWVLALFVSPLSMNLLLRYVQGQDTTKVSPYLFVFGIFGAPIVASTAYQGATYRLSEIGLRLRGLLGHAVFEKLLRVKAGGGGSKEDGEDVDDEDEPDEEVTEDGASTDSAPSPTSSGSKSGGSEAVGRVNNLVGTDIDVITSSLTTSLQLFGVLPKLFVSLLFLYFLLGWSAFIALASIAAFAPMSTIVSRKYGAIQEEIMKATDKRITIVQELVSSVRIIKMFAWEKSMMGKIYEAREIELGRITKRAKVYAGMMGLSTGVPMVVTLSTFGAYVFGMKQTLTASTAFTSMSLFGLLREAVISSTYLLSAFMRAKVSLNRITRFLSDTEELDSSPRSFEGDTISFKNAVFRFSRYNSKGSQPFELFVNDLTIPMGKTTIIAGDVGSGKSALLLALLGELHRRSGEVKFPARVKTSFAAQSAWLLDDTVKANILFGEKYDKERYEDTIRACSLEEDLKGFEEGDETRVGEKGVSMSGSVPLHFDLDILDSRSNRCIGFAVRGQKQRVALARAVYSQSEIVLLDDVLSAVDSTTVAAVVENCLNGPLLAGRTVVLVTHFVKLCTRRIKNCEHVVTLHDGEIESIETPEKRDKKHLSPSDAPGMRRTSSNISTTSSFDQRVPKSKKEEDEAASRKKEQEQKLHGADEGDAGTDISFRVYKKYFTVMGGWVFWTLYALVNLVAHVFMLSQFFVLPKGWFIGRWVNAEDRDSRKVAYFTLYSLIQLASALSLTAMYLVLIFGAIRASRTLHGRLTSAIFGAPFRFFDETPQGRITNRFSKDTEILDTEQVENLQPVLDYSVQVLFVAITISVILPVFLLPAAFISAIFFFLGRLYILNALAARRQVASARSPLFSTLGDASTGVTTIRAFGREKAFSTQYRDQTDRYNQMQLYEFGLDRWLEERSDMVGATVSFIVGLLALRAGLSSGITGFLVSTGLEFTNRILYVVRAINKNELSLNSVQRILEYSDIEQEVQTSGKGDPPKDWPEGSIEFNKYSARYSHDGPDVLHELSFKIKAGEKIGIVGPSGCGKSSLSLALLRFIIGSNGEILVDDRKVSETNLEALRSRMTLIPQDPTLFSGTLRSNLDPNEEYDDAVLWAAVQRSGFAGHEGDAKNRNKGMSLDTVVQTGGSNFSQGQRQLLSLARALVRSSKIIILDEATASLDNESDNTLQEVIRSEFKRCTNLTIAHRLESVIDFDRILVLEHGKVVEFDTPTRLLENQKSAFYDLCQSSGNFDELKQAAAACAGSKGPAKK
ncbi:BZ3500_MvSof-1268-A1-R1_Chr3-3g06545 [Microbotryum saponariae]|uniref:BZ3500_MvSof-1268-A1-R1_Chr3-3g06545 protein n=1 Tax=Microbotryum saponariae TaxID=289078 RepID=A0A2X0N0F2_9BASI|nr:BZ3500_MvSof-1268-A1-R1_Chr3-3g06545 [Microbotryum saponariae]SDA04512.1 BZ3501_MvSof-1269-A2-R1_Chr3-2g06232 [Microbotryum saponariae]